MFSKAGTLIRHLPLMAKIGALLILRTFIRLYVRAYWRRKGVDIEPTARLIYASDPLMDLGSGTYVGHFTVLLAQATPDCKAAPLLKIGERTWIGDHVNIRASGGLIVIGKGCLIANAVTIISCTHGTKLGTYMRDQPWIRKDVSIGDDVWIGAGVTLLPGSQIGEGAIVGAGAVVRGTVNPYEIVVGVPTRAIGSRNNQE
jgi:acetyltransferase-like isoleucine patch superfamily enzyme